MALLLCLLVLVKLAGQTTLNGTTQWIRHRAELITTHLGLPRKPMPGANYVLLAKDNQPTLQEDCEDLFEDLTPALLP